MSPPRYSFFSPRQGHWLWFWPRIALVLFIAAVSGLLWYSAREEREAQRIVLINDVLWAEQNLQFQFDQTEERLRGIASADQERALTESDFRGRLNLLMSGNPSVIGAQVYGADGHLRFASGASLGADTAALAATIELAHATGRPTYSTLFWIGHEACVVATVPVGDEIAVALISLPRLVAQQVPWWFATKYRLTLSDADGVVLASKSRVEAGTEGLSYQLAFDPPGHGLLLRVTAYDTGSSVMQKLLIVSVVALALAVLFSWWRLRRHIQGRLAAEAALREEHAFRKAMEDSLSVGMRARDMEGRIVYVNPAFCKMVGYRQEELIGMLPPYPYWDPDALERHKHQNAAVLSGLAPLTGFESRIRHRDGHYVDTMIYTTPLIDAHGRQRGWMSSVLDITERKRSEHFTRQQEEKLQQTARLTSMGEMASTLAHELNQPLMAMSSYASAAKQLANNGEQRELLVGTLDKIADQAHRAAQIVRRIREFVRRRTPHHEPCDLNALIDDAVGLIEADARARGMRITSELDRKLPAIQADHILLEQVLINLIRNGMDASANQPAARRTIEVSSRRDGDMVQVSVADAGLGITDDAVEHLFEAFYTTKSLGMGLGLSICRSVIENHHGRLWFEPRDGGGTIFHFTLPVTTSETTP